MLGSEGSSLDHYSGRPFVDFLCDASTHRPIIRIIVGTVGQLSRSLQQYLVLSSVQGDRFLFVPHSHHNLAKTFLWLGGGSAILLLFFFSSCLDLCL